MSVITISKKHLISIQDFSRQEIETIIERGNYWAQPGGSKTPYQINKDSEHTVLDLGSNFQNPIICNLFFEPSTRTRFSFEVAAKRLGYHVLNFHPNSSSTQKGESIYDTIKTLEAMGVNTAIVRTKEEKLLREIAPRVDLALINAGSGTKEHPSQCLLDLLTMKQHFGNIEGLKVAIIGDIKHSRVASSNISGLSKLGAQVMLSGPSELQLSQADMEAYFDKEALNATTNVDIDTAIKEADVVMMLRVQLERGSCPDGGRLQDNLEGYHEKYGLTLERANAMQKHAMIMHPAPFNRGVEIDGDLVEGPKSLIYRQVANGVAVRMAILERALEL